QMASVKRKNGSCWLNGGRRHHCSTEGRRDPFQIMGAFQHHEVAGHKPLTDATQPAQEIAAASPSHFHTVVMDFANGVAVIIARPLALSWRMANGLMGRSTRGEVIEQVLDK